jgi:hypothetical protein
MLVPRALRTLCLSALVLTGCVCSEPGGADGGDGGVPVEEDAGVTCTPPFTTDPCLRGVCDSDGTPRLVPVDDGTALATQTAGNCKSRVCVGGTATDVTDDTDLPDDGRECTLNLCVSGAPSHPALAAGTTCSGGACDGAGSCVGCTQASQCAGVDTECRVRTCVAGTCGFSNTPSGTPLAAQTPADCKRLQCDGNGAAVSVPDSADLNEDGNQCTLDTCNNGTPVRTNAPIDTACGVNLRCSATGTCVGCNGPIDCGAAPACKQAICTAGTCGISNAANGSTCTDGNACTTTDTCQSGVCTSSNPVVCGQLDQCHVAGVCNTATGACTNPNAVDGTTCNDSNACTQTDACQSGTCQGTNPVVCTAMDTCHSVGVCQSATGTCTNPTLSNGTTCSDGNPCTQTDTCQTGTCTGTNPVSCSALDQCHVAGVCQPADGGCTNPNRNDGTGCNDSNACTQTDTCQSGACTGANPVVCTASDQCHDAGVCNTSTGVCSNPSAPNGAGCTDGDACTQTDTCQTGACIGANPVVCTASDQCHDAGVCNTSTGVCSNPGAPNGAGCTDGDACTQTDTCQSGSCQGTNPVVCSALDLCHLAGLCAPATGTCSNPFADGGTPCSFNGGNQCDGAGTCYLGLPWVVGTIPAEGATNQSYATTVTVLFSEAMDALTVTALPADGACTGSLQISNDGFTTCLGVGTLNMISGNTAAVATLAPELSCGTTYRVRVTSAALTPDARPITGYTTPTGFTTGSCYDDLSGSVVISQVYTAGGNSGATLNADLIELHNRGEFAVNLGSWSLQYASANGTTWSRLNLTGSIAPGGYCLAQVSSVGGNGGAPPTPDVTGTSLSLSASDGRVALVGNQTTLSGLCPASSAIIDYVGYGASATCLDAAPPVALSSPTLNALFRRIEGCQDTDANSADFFEAAVFPRNSATAPWACVAANESNQAAEADDCVLQFPSSVDSEAGVTSPTLYGRIFEAGVTEGAGAAPQVRAQLGYGPFNTNASTQSALWTWVDATFNAQYGDDDEYQASFTTPANGSYRYVYRFSLGGMPWTYCDLDGAGSNSTLRFDPSQSGVMTIVPDGGA